VIHPTLAAALTYADRGWHVLPIPRGRKYPRFEEWQNLATIDTDLIGVWFERWPDDGVGIACGAVSGIFVIDVDVNDGKVGDKTLRDLEAIHGELPETYTVRTPTGGWHYYFRYDSARPISNGKLGLHVDTRGDGGQVVAPPTLHPDTGTPYQVYLDVPVAEAPDWVYDILLAAPAAAPAVVRHTDTDDDDDGPAKEFNGRHTWDELLTADGWTLHHVDAKGTSHWTRPGKDKRHGSSATTGYQGRDCLKVFSPNAGLEEGRAYSRFGYYAATKHGDDRSAAARQLLADGYGPDLLGWIGDGGRTVDPVTGEVTFDEPWEVPVPLGMAPSDLPAFPVEVFPPWLAEQCEVVAADIQVPIDLPAMVALAALSMAASGRLNVKRDGWESATNLYLVVASPPGQGKSPVFTAMTKCIKSYEAEMHRDMAPAIAKAEMARRVYEKQARKAEEKGDVDTAWGFQEQALSVDVPIKPRLVAEDATPEALTRLLGEQKGWLGVLSSEGGLFDLMTGQYSDRANLDVYLKGWGAEEITVDRIGRDSDHVERAVLTIGLTVQPHVIRKLADRPELAGRGLTARFMYAMPESNVGKRDMTQRQLGRERQQHVYDAFIVDLYRRMRSYQTPGTVELGDAQVERFNQWRQSIEVRRAVGGDLEALAEWTTKLEASVLRLAALLHVAHGGAHHGQLDDQALDGALVVADYWIEHAFAVHDLWGTDDALVRARGILGWLVDKGVADFSISELQRHARRHVNHVEDGVRPVEILIERGWVRQLFDGPVKVGARGKHAQRFALHPDAVEHHSRHSQGKTGSSAQNAPTIRAIRSIRLEAFQDHFTHSLETPGEISADGAGDGVPLANGANGANGVSSADEAEPVDNYRAIPPPTFDRSAIEEML
jgi:replicative DNA helicase